MMGAQLELTYINAQRIDVGINHTIGSQAGGLYLEKSPLVKEQPEFFQQFSSLTEPT